MKALAVILAFLLLVLPHPAAAAAVVVTGLAVCAAAGWLVWRASRFRSCPHMRRLA